MNGDVLSESQNGTIDQANLSLFGTAANVMLANAASSGSFSNFANNGSESAAELGSTELGMPKLLEFFEYQRATGTQNFPDDFGTQLFGFVLTLFTSFRRILATGGEG